tara:strand:- start:133 stop:390 length:258 start_codon:yes stop_codon:yes gene_type:complete
MPYVICHINEYHDESGKRICKPDVLIHGVWKDLKDAAKYVKIVESRKFYKKDTLIISSIPNKYEDKHWEKYVAIGDNYTLDVRNS